MRKLLIASLFFVLSLVSVASAADVAYVLTDMIHYDANLVSALGDIDLTVEVIDDSEIDSTDFSEYQFMLIGDYSFSDPEDVPVNDVPALILNSKHMDEWNWLNRWISSKTSSQPISVYSSNITSHYINQGYSGEFDAYTSSLATLTYINKNYKAPLLKAVIGVNSVTDLSGAIVVAEPGMNLRNGEVSNVKSVFYGMFDSDYWTTESEDLFKQSARFLIIDFVAPTVSDISVSDITNSTAVINFTTDKDANYTLEYGETTSFGSSVETISLDIDHSAFLSGLSERTTYYYAITACNKDNICEQTSTYSFTTLDLTAPYLANQEANATNHTADVTVETTEAGTAQLFFGMDGNYSYSTAVQDINLTTVFSLTGLTDKTTYDYYVELCDVYGNCRDGAGDSFTTTDITAPKAPSNYKIGVKHPGNYVELSWDEAVDDAVKYNVYTAETADGFNFSNKVATVSTNYYVDMNADSSQATFYVVRAEDAHGNEEENENVLAAFAVYLQQGYNLISNPLVAQESGIENYLTQNGSYNPISEVKQYDANNSEFVVASFDGSVWNESLSLGPGVGFFVYSDSMTTFRFVGHVPVETSVPIYEGMNLVGLSSISDSTVSGFVSEDDIVEVGKRNANGQYTLSTYSSGWSDDFAIEPGIGYWVKSNKDTIMDVTP